MKKTFERMKKDLQDIISDPKIKNPQMLDSAIDTYMELYENTVGFDYFKNGEGNICRNLGRQRYHAKQPKRKNCKGDTAKILICRTCLLPVYDEDGNNIHVKDANGHEYKCDCL